MNIKNLLLGQIDGKMVFQININISVVKANCLAIICIVAVALHPGNSYAQDNSNNNKKPYWFNTGIGGSSSGISPGVGFSYQSGRSSLISFRFIYNQWLEGLFCDTPPLQVWDVGALYGGIAKASYGFVSVSGGVSIVGRVRRGKLINGGWFGDEYEKLTSNNVGLPIEVQLFWTPKSYLGFGIYGFANANPEKSFIGGLFCIQIGRLK